MATLLLRDTTDRIALAHERVLSLREWQQGCWAAVMSAPDDFGPLPGTPEGFVTCIAAGLKRAGIKPIAFAHCLEALSASWLDHAVNDDAVVALERRYASLVDLAEHALAARLATLTQPFVLILDGYGRVRLTVQYRPDDRLRTIFDLMDMVAVLRDRTVRSARISVAKQS